MPAGDPTPRMTFYRAADAPTIEQDGIMSMPEISPAVHAGLDLSPIMDGQRVTVLFKGEGPDGFSLVHSWFCAGFRLPRHSHSADCLYYVLSGEIAMGTRVSRPKFTAAMTSATSAQRAIASGRLSIMPL